MKKDINSEVVYLKLNKGKSLFYDQIAGIKIANNMVVKTDMATINSTKRLKGSLGNGHIVNATEEEYNAYLKQAEADVKQANEDAAAKVGKSNPPKVKKTKDEDEDEDEEDEDEEDDIEEMTKTELMEYLKTKKNYTPDQMKEAGKLKLEDLVKSVKETK